MKHILTNTRSGALSPIVNMLFIALGFLLCSVFTAFGSMLKSNRHNVAFKQQGA